MMLEILKRSVSGKVKPVLSAAVLAAGVFSGCISSTPVSPRRPASEPVLKVDDNTVARRKAAFIRATGKSKVRGVVIYPQSWKDHPADDVIKRAKSYRFNRIYFVISSELELSENLENLLDSSIKAGIAPYIVIRQRDYCKRFRGNAFIRSFSKEYPDVFEVSKMVAEYVKSGRASGFVILIEPHRFTSVEQRQGGIDSCFIWSDLNFGAGCDNDILMKKSFATAAKAAKLNVPFTPAIADFYHEWAVDGKLSTGNINETAKLADGSPEVLLLSTGNKPSEMAAGIKNEFDAAKCSIIPVFMVADHLSEDTARLRRRNFSDFVRGIGFGVGKLTLRKSYSGFVTGPLRSLEYMSLEKE